MDLNAFYEAEFDQHQSALDATREALMEPFFRLIGICAEAIRAGNKLGHMLCGALEQELGLI